MEGSEPCAVVVVAAGLGTRLGGDRPKAFVEVGGRPLLVWTLEALASSVKNGVVVVPKGHEKRTKKILQHLDLQKSFGVCRGGGSRRESVANGLDALGAFDGVVLVHDGVRPRVTDRLVRAVRRAAEQHGAAVAALRVTDTIKRVDGAQVQRTEERDELVAVQTPQGFDADLLRRAHQAHVQGAAEPTDDAAMVELLGHPVRWVTGDPDNTKITTPHDLRRFAAQMVPPRLGHGWDLHRLVVGRPLVLGGVTIPHDSGSLGHSDGDVVCHAVIDALLGAAGLGDIGQHFPDTDPKLRGACSLDLLAQTAAQVQRQGYRPANLDVTVVCQRPRLAPFRRAMEDNISISLSILSDQVNIKATTAERLGDLGRGRAVQAHAVAMLVPR